MYGDRKHAPMYGNCKHAPSPSVMLSVAETSQIPRQATSRRAIVPPKAGLNDRGKQSPLHPLYTRGACLRSPYMLNMTAGLGST